MESFLQDLRYAVRQLTTNPGFSAIAIITFALGIGPATAVLSFADRLVLAPIPGVRESSRLAAMNYGTLTPRGGYSPHFIAGRENEVFVKELPAIAAMAGYQGAYTVIATGSAPAEACTGAYVSGDYFRTLGVEAQLGRMIGPEDDRPGNAMVAVISHKVWQAGFGGAGDVVNKTFRANGELLTVIGVAPKGFHGPLRLGDENIWIPGAAQGLLQHYPPEVWPRLGYYEFVLRLALGATFEAAQDQLQVAATRIAALHPEDRDYEKLRARLYPGIGVAPGARGTTSTTVQLLLGVAALLLIVACANAANLMLFRGSRRRGETALRQAIGATRGRLIRARVIETAFLALAGGIAGTLVALSMIQWFEGASLRVGRSVTEVSLNWRVLSMSWTAALVTGIVTGILPAVTTSRVDLVTALKESQRTGSTARAPLRASLAVLQLAVSLTLLVGSFLFIRTLVNLRRVDLGFDPSRVTTLSVRTRSLGYSPERLAVYARQLLERVRATPGVEVAGWSSVAPLMGGLLYDRILKVTTGGEDTIQVSENAVSPSYFRMLGMQLLRGRTFTEDEDAPGLSPSSSIIISEALARRLFGDGDPTGQTVRYHRRPERYVVVGVVSNVRVADLKTPDVPDFSVYSTGFGGYGRTVLMVRSSLTDAAAEKAIRNAATEVDPLVPMTRIRSLQSVVDAHVAEQALFMKVLTLLAVLSVALASVGVAGLVAQSVAERTREFGIRLALGADRPNILVLVVRQGASLVLFGVPAGILLSGILSRLVRAKLYSVSPLEPAVYAVAAGVLVAVTLVATLLPARAATRVDPMVALRSE